MQYIVLTHIKRCITLSVHDMNAVANMVGAMDMSKGSVSRNVEVCQKCGSLSALQKARGKFTVGIKGAISLSSCWGYSSHPPAKIESTDGRMWFAILSIHIVGGTLNLVR